jgi:hypothetical protein
MPTGTNQSAKNTKKRLLRSVFLSSTEVFYDFAETLAGTQYAT